MQTMLPKMERIIGTTGREKQVYQIHLVSQRNWIYIYIYITACMGYMSTV